VNEGRRTLLAPPHGRAWLYALFLLMIPGVLWAAAVAAPFLPLATAAKVWLAAGFAVAAEVTVRYRRHLDPRSWFRKAGKSG